MASITIEPRNPLDVKPADLESFYLAVREECPSNVNVELLRGTEMRPGRRGVTWWQLVLVQLNEIPEDIRGAIIGIVLDRFWTWARERFKRTREAGFGADRRPKHITIQAGDGTVVIERVARHGARRLADPKASEPVQQTRKRPSSSNAPSKKQGAQRDAARPATQRNTATARSNSRVVKRKK